MITLSAIHVYPVKSCRGLELEQARLDATGLAHDREWMIVDANGRFLTQREEPRLALIEVRLRADALVLGAPGMVDLVVPLEGDRGEPRRVVVWRDACLARDEGDAPARWLGDFLGRRLGLVRFDPGQPRRSDPAWTGDDVAYSQFADGFALLAISRASLEDLNRRLSVPLPMNRFRPNLVLDGLPPYGEDELGEFRSGDIRLRAVKPCTRCRITTTNQDTGAVESEEPLRTLRTYRWNAALRGVAFGQNVIVLAGTGESLYPGMTFERVSAP